jgi:hypothetical protein
MSGTKSQIQQTTVTRNIQCENMQSLVIRKTHERISLAHKHEG